jgi:alkylation response protein AidB-like acyl-CoA dehydrogenase
MDHDLSPEANTLRDMVRAFLERKSPESDVRRVIETGTGRDDDVWQQMAAQLGLQGLLVPEELGGQGSSFVEVSVVLEEMGRSLLPGPFFSSAVLATSALLATHDPAARELLGELASGQRVATVAFSEGVTGRPDESTVVAREADSSWVLDGQIDIVLDAQAVDVLLVVARTGRDVGLFMVPATETGVAIAPLKTLDQTRQVGRVELNGVVAQCVGRDFAAAQRHVLSLAAAGLAAELAGVTQRVLEMAVDYAKLREQFGVPIGSFQAVKHLCAEIFCTAESATAVARHAARVASDEPASLGLAASLAKAYASQACAEAAEKNIQIHGGIGYTWEHPAHLYLRKAKAGEMLFGDSARHRRNLSGLLGLTAGADGVSIADSVVIDEPVGV